jgi:hypothetical protein
MKNKEIHKTFSSFSCSSQFFSLILQRKAQNQEYDWVLCLFDIKLWHTT